MKKLFVLALMTVITFLGISEPAFAGLPYGSHDSSWLPNYLRQIQYIQENSCDAVAMIPYSGRVLYTCPNGQELWMQVLVPTQSSPLFMYFKNRKKDDDEDAADAASTSASVNASF